MDLPLTPELLGSIAAPAIGAAAYAYRCYLVARDRAAQRTAILSAVGHPEVLAALAKLDAPDLKGPTPLLVAAVIAGTLAANATLAAPLVGVELPAATIGAAVMPGRCTAQDCRPPAYCAAGICQAEAKPPAPPAPAPEPDPAAPAPEPVLPPGPGRGARPRKDDDEAPVGPSSSYARAPWEETLPGWRPPWALDPAGESL